MKILCALLFLFLGLASVTAQDSPFSLYSPSIVSAGAGITVHEHIVRISAGARIDNNMETFVYLRSGYRLAKSGLCTIWIEPFWMNYNISRGGYNTPVGVDFNIIDRRYISAGVRLDLYGRTKGLFSGLVYEPSAYLTAQIIRK